MTGTSGADLIRVGADDDSLSGALQMLTPSMDGGGADILPDQDGDDRVFGSYGADVLS